MAVEDSSSDLLGPEEAAFEEWVASPPGAVPPDGPKHTHYVVTKRLGGGAFGEVLQAQHVTSGRVMALKHVLVRRPDKGIPDNLLREIKALQHVSHPHVVSLLDYFPRGANLVLAFEFCHGDLHTLLDGRKEPLQPACAKGVIHQVLLGTAACHEHRVLHRDIKPGNILIGADGRLKLADFGLARFMHPSDQRAPVSDTAASARDVDGADPGQAQKGGDNGTAEDAHSRDTVEYTHTVQTRWYRSPELLYGSRTYGPAADVWSCGVILAELMGTGPLFPGDSDIDQLLCVLRLLGTPTEESWPDAAKLPDFGKISVAESAPGDIAAKVPGAGSPAALALVSSLIALDPTRRPTAADALQHAFFSEDPPSLDPPLAVEELRRCSGSWSGVKAKGEGAGEVGGGGRVKSQRDEAVDSVASGRGGGETAGWQPPRPTHEALRTALVRLGLDMELAALDEQDGASA